MFRPSRLPFWLLYPAWLAFCAALFLILQAVDPEDPSRRADRIRGDAAGEVALEILRARDPERFAGYDVVNVAWARPREVGPDARWVVLLDRAERSALEDAFVVELEPRGTLIRIRPVPRE